jgi:hypothetical protein
MKAGLFRSKIYTRRCSETLTRPEEHWSLRPRYLDAQVADSFHFAGKLIKMLNIRSTHAASSAESTKPIVIMSPTAVVHLEYDLDLSPSQNGWTRFVCISDTHARSFPVPPGDVLLHSGDLTNTGTYQEFELTMNWLYGLPHKNKM